MMRNGRDIKIVIDGEMMDVDPALAVAALIPEEIGMDIESADQNGSEMATGSAAETRDGQSVPIENTGNVENVEKQSPRDSDHRYEHRLHRE